jgi:hypothetical protein
VPTLSVEWWELTRHAIREGTRLGVNIGLFNSAGWSQSGGPWVGTEQSMRYLKSAELAVRGPSQFRGKLPVPSPDFRRVAVTAIPLRSGSNGSISRLSPQVTTVPRLDNTRRLTDGDTAAAFRFGKDALQNKSLVIDLEVKKTFTARSLVLHPARIPFGGTLTLLAGEGERFREIAATKIDQPSDFPTGPEKYGPLALSFPPVKSTHFRLVFTGIDGDGGLREIELLTEPRLQHFSEKQLARMYQGKLPL